MSDQRGGIPMPRIEFRQLRYFLAVVEEGSLRKAASKLGMSQPPLSRQIQQLEADLQVELFERSGRGMILSGAGQELVVHARAILDRAAQAVKDLRDAVDDPVNRLSIGFLDDFMGGFLPGLLADLAKARPTLRLRSHLSVTWNILSDIKLGRIDAGFVALPLPTSASSLNVMRFPPLPIVAVLPLHHPLAHCTSVNLKDLRHERIISAPVFPESGFYQQINAMFQRAGFSPDSFMEIWPADHIAQFIARGVGVTFTTAGSIIAHKAEVAVCPVDDSEAVIQPAVVWRAGGVTKTLAAFLDRCRAYSVKMP